MNTIAGIAFFLSGLTNGAELTVGTGFATQNDVFINPIGIIRLEVPAYQEQNWGLMLKATHLSSIPDRYDHANGTEINMASIEFTVRIR